MHTQPSKMQLKPELVAKAKQELIGKVEELALLRPSDRYQMMRVLEVPTSGRLSMYQPAVDNVLHPLVDCLV